MPSVGQSRPSLTQRLRAVVVDINIRRPVSAQDRVGVLLRVLHRAIFCSESGRFCSAEFQCTHCAVNSCCCELARTASVRLASRLCCLLAGLAAVANLRAAETGSCCSSFGQRSAIATGLVALFYSAILR